MNLTDEDIEEFQKAWKEEFQEEITVDQARYEANLLIELYTVLLEPSSTKERVRFPERVLPRYVDSVQKKGSKE